MEDNKTNGNSDDFKELDLDIVSNYNFKSSKKEPNISNYGIILFGFIFFLIPSLIFLKTLTNIFLNGFDIAYIFAIPFISIFIFIGLAISLYGMVENYGDQNFVSNNVIPVMKTIKINDIVIIKKEYKSLELVLPQNEFPNLKYPASILICKDSGKSVNFITNVKSGVSLIKNIEQLISNVSEGRDLNNSADVLLIAVLYLWTNRAIHLISYKASDNFLGINFNRNKKKYMFIEGENLEEFYKSKNLGIIEKSILNVINSSKFDYSDNDLNQVAKKIIDSKCKFPEKIFPDMARNQGLELDLIKSNNDYKYNIKSEYKNLFKTSSKDIYLYIQDFGTSYPEFLSQFRDDINLGIKSMNYNN